MSEIELKIVQISRDYLASRLPDFDFAVHPPIVSGTEDYWIVDYQLPKGFIGGTPKVFIDKKTLKVVRAIATQ